MPDVATMKYADPNGANTYYDGHSVDVLRYADVLLSRAEALNEIGGPTAEAVGSLVNQVKARSHAKLLVASAILARQLSAMLYCRNVVGNYITKAKEGPI
jgi:hypothetical protein